MKHTKTLFLSTAFVACLNIECIGKSIDISTQVSPKQSNSTQTVSISEIKTHEKRFDRLYVGLFGGVTQRNIDYKLRPTSPEIKHLMSFYESNYIKCGFLIGPYAGYGKSFGNFYSGIEGSIHYDSANEWKNHLMSFENDPLIFKTQYKKEWGFGLAARLGILANKDTLIYIKPAFEFSKDKCTTKNSSDQSSISGWKVKLSPGIGAEYFINDDISLRAEYSYSFGIGNYKMKEKVRADDLMWFEASYTSHSLKIGVSYSF